MATRYGQSGTSAPKHKPQIFHTKDVRKCLPVMEAIIQDGKPVAFDAEGINLSAKGRMTLLQICTWDGRIYLLDLIDADQPDEPKFGRKLLENGGVKAMLESSKVEKVTHSCSNDSSALYHQFDIRLNAPQIFDTQAADQALQTLDGTVFPRRKNLALLADDYGTPEHPLKDDHGTWMEKDKEAWGKRPLSKDMIDYACYDVDILIPELYDELKRKLQNNGCWSRYQQMVEWNVAFYIDKDRVLAEKAVAQKEGVQRLFSQIQQKYTARTPLDNLTDDERHSLRLLQDNRDVWKMFNNPTVKALEEVLQLEFIAEIRKEVEENPPEYFLPGFKMHRLYTLGKHPNQNIREASRALQSEIKASKEKSGAKRTGGGGRGRGRGGYRGRGGRR